MQRWERQQAQWVEGALNKQAYILFYQAKRSIRESPKSEVNGPLEKQQSIEKLSTASQSPPFTKVEEANLKEVEDFKNSFFLTKQAKISERPLQKIVRPSEKLKKQPKQPEDKKEEEPPK